MQEAFRDCHGLQCGFCTPGMVMSAIDLVQRHPRRRREDDPRAARRQPLPLHGLPEHREGGPAGRGGDGRRTGGATMGANDRGSHRPVDQAQGRRALPHGPGQFTDDVRCRTRRTRISCARRTRTRRSGRSTRAQAKKSPGVLAIYTGDDLDRRQWPALRLADHRHRRHADEGAAASDARQGQGPPRGRPRRARHRRDARPGEGRRRADRGRLRRAARGRELRRRAEGGAPQMHDEAPGTSATRGRSATRPRSTPLSPRPRTSRSSTSSTTG